MRIKKNVANIYVSKSSSLTSTHFIFRLEKEKEVWIDIKIDNSYPRRSGKELEEMKEENINNIAIALKKILSNIKTKVSCKFYFNHEKSWDMAFTKIGLILPQSIKRKEPIEEDDTDMIFKALFRC